MLDVIQFIPIMTSKMHTFHKCHTHIFPYILVRLGKQSFTQLLSPKENLHFIYSEENLHFIQIGKFNRG